MKVSDHIHALKIPFKVPIAPDKLLDRFVYAYIIIGQKITLLDSGVAGADLAIYDYVLAQAREPKEIQTLILSHSHPDHIGSAKQIKEAIKCMVASHEAERQWIEDTDKQFRERPVPGFNLLVAGPVVVDRLLEDGEILEIEKGLNCTVLHSPGHSKGSISLHFESEGVLFTADSLPVAGDLPIYESIVESVKSIRMLKAIQGVQTLISSWEAPVQGPADIARKMDSSLDYLQRIHRAVLDAHDGGSTDPMQLCAKVVGALGLPPLAANPLVARSFASSLAPEAKGLLD